MSPSITFSPTPLEFPLSEVYKVPLIFIVVGVGDSLTTAPVFILNELKPLLPISTE